MKQAALALCWIAVIAAGAFLRFDQLSKRPFHADEATGARLTAARMESGDYRFDPLHYHGPLLSSLAIPLARTHGENRWQELTKSSLRLLPALAGTLLLLVPLLWRKRIGDGPMLLATSLLATSPLLVYYSRMFIHESLLVLFGMLTLACLIRFPRYGIPGFFIGLMFATKETFAISILAWAGAVILVAWEQRKTINRAWLLAAWVSYRVPLGVSLLLAALSSAFLYSDGFRQPSGIVDAIRTFFVYETVAGHDKAFTYYANLLAIPTKSAGLWWFGTPVLVLALLAYFSSFGREAGSKPLIRFLAYSAAGHFLIYSLIAYKTPWLASLPWAHVCLLAGFALVGFPRRSLTVKAVLGLLVIASLVTQFRQTRHATGRLASDERNPFAYVPTRNDLEDLAPWLEKLRQAAPEIPLEPVAVVGADYWPLPWYLRGFDTIGYWTEAPAEMESQPLVFTMPEAGEAVAARLMDTHIQLPRGLRAGVPMLLFVRMDIWNRWIEDDG
jgi:uncharacterized protein (TIGR03663 family)